MVRHGQTTFNVEGRLQGWRDSPLSGLGRTQAQGHGALLKTLIPNLEGFRLVSSPLGRALDTARIICAGLGLAGDRIETDGRLKELSFGEWEGLTLAELEARVPGAWEARRRDRWRFVPPGGESYEMMAVRVGAWLDEVDRPTIAVCHGITGRVLRGLYGGLTEEEILALDEPQDAVFHLTRGSIARFEHPDEDQTLSV